MKYPKISFVTPMLEKDFRVIALLKSIRKQDYPQEKIEILIIDGGSNPEVLKESKKYGVKIFYNPKILAEGAGMGKDQGIWKSKGKYVVIAESDIELIGKNWIKKMIIPLEENPELFASVPKLHISNLDSVTNRYLSYVGVDPFASYKAFDGLISLGKIKGRMKKGFELFELKKSAPYCMGSNGFMFRRDLTKKVGDYAQDVEFIARLAKNNYNKFAYVREAEVWHKNVKSLFDFARKRIKWTRNYSNVYVKEKKEFKWITNKKDFFIYVIKNMLIFPQVPVAISNLLNKRDIAWSLHPFLMFFSTGLNIYFTLQSRDMWKQIFNAS